MLYFKLNFFVLHRKLNYRKISKMHEIFYEINNYLPQVLIPRALIPQVLIPRAVIPQVLILQVLII